MVISSQINNKDKKFDDNLFLVPQLNLNLSKKMTRTKEREKKDFLCWITYNQVVSWSLPCHCKVLDL